MVLISRSVIAAKGVLFTSEMTLDALFATVIHFNMIERLKNSAGHLVGTSPDV